LKEEKDVSTTRHACKGSDATSIRGKRWQRHSDISGRHGKESRGETEANGFVTLYAMKSCINRPFSLSGTLIFTKWDVRDELS